MGRNKQLDEFAKYIAGGLVANPDVMTQMMTAERVKPGKTRIQHLAKLAYDIAEACIQEGDSR